MKKIILLLTILLFPFTKSLFAQAGNLDNTFDGDGITTTAIGSGDDIAQTLAVQPDGKIIVGGYSFNGTDADFALVRYKNDGSLDSAFNTNGKVTTPIGATDDYINSVAIQTDGKIVAGGYSSNGSNFDFALARYNTDGTLDNTFDTDGKLTTDFNSGIDRIYSVAIQTDGKIVVAGSSYNGIKEAFALARYNGDGSLDNTFSTDGKLTTDIGTSGDEAFSMALQSDGKIVASGYSITSGHGHFALARYNMDGTLDTGFDSDGMLTTVFSATFDYAQSVAIQSDGKIVAGGYSLNATDADFAMARYNTDGSLDNSFSSDGKVTTAVGTSNDQAYSVAIQPDGKIIIAGWSYHLTSLDFALVRYTSSGALDNSFSSDGKLTTAIGSADDVAYSVKMQPNGNIVAAGYSFNGTNYDFAVARYLSGLALGVIDAAGSASAQFIYPNPVQQVATLEYTLNKVESISIRLLDLQGKIITSFIDSENQEPGEHKQDIVVPKQLPSGSYIIIISTASGGQVSIKIVK